MPSTGEQNVSRTPALVCVVDDDESVRESLPDLLRAVGFAAAAYSSAEEYLEANLVDETACLLLDVTLPGMSGPDLQRELARRGHAIPTIFMTAHGDAAVRSTLLATGAVECLFKPFSETALVYALRAAVSRS
jgi:FixJ family two-component response regulator